MGVIRVIYHTTQQICVSIFVLVLRVYICGKTHVISQTTNQMWVYILVSCVYAYGKTRIVYQTTKQMCVYILERWGAGVEYHFQEFNAPCAPS